MDKLDIDGNGQGRQMNGKGSGTTHSDGDGYGSGDSLNHGDGIGGGHNYGEGSGISIAAVLNPSDF